VVQVGAFSDTAKVREVRRKLEQAGLSTFIQSVDGKDGKSTTRVRVGPFPSREEADKAAAKVRKLDLPAAVLRI
jgi:DedD protein